MKKILVPVDFSECSYHAAEVAAQIAKKADARLYILHIMDIPVYDRNDSFQSYSNTAEGLFWMKLVKKRFKELFSQPFMKGVNAVEVLQFDGIYDTIASQAKEHEIDLIVMGSHGDSGAHELFIGSNTEKVVRIAECPVLTIKHRIENFNLKDVVFASNFFGEAKDNFEKLFKFIKLFNAKLHLVKINTPDQFEPTPYSELLINDFAKSWSLQDYTVHIFNARTVLQGINEVSKRIDADLISMETHGKPSLEIFFKGSHTQSVVNHSEVPVLTVRIQSYHQDLKPFPDLNSPY